MEKWDYLMVLLLDIWSILNNNVKHDYIVRVTMENQCTIMKNFLFSEIFYKHIRLSTCLKKLNGVTNLENNIFYKMVKLFTDDIVTLHEMMLHYFTNDNTICYWFEIFQWIYVISEVIRCCAQTHDHVNIVYQASHDMNI